MKTREAVRRLCAWYSRQARALPWRQSPEPYRIWISEVMLQQTQVATVIPYYHAFLEKFPTLTALAKAREENVLAAWSGLGYYSRARNLHRGAQYLVEKHGGNFPRDRETMLTVPGIGPYTAGAVLSIAFDLAVPIVDGNVQRVFSRYFAIHQPIQDRAVQKIFWEKADEWVRQSDSPRVLNQALMELGATLCTKGTPSCAVCPLSTSCQAHAEGSEAKLPVKKPPREKVDLFWVGVVLENEGRVFLHQNAPGEWWAGLWDFPRVDAGTEEKAPAAFETWRRAHLPKASWKPLAFQRHTVTHHRIRVAPYLCRVDRPAALARLRGEWFEPARLPELPLSSLVKKVLSAHIW